ncbi:radical SAM protein [archaeon]|nr:radical SAM protein [archaeon]
MNITKTKIMLQASGVRMDNCHVGELHARFDYDHSGFFMEDVPVIVRPGKWTEYSPFEIREQNGGHAIFDDGEFFTKVTIPPKPGFLEKTTSEGVPMYRLGELIFTGNFSLMVNQECFFWKTGKQCCFCTVGKQDFLKTKTPEQIVEAVGAGVGEGVIKRVNISTGWQDGPDLGIACVAEVIKKVKEHFDLPVSASDILPPEDEKYLERLFEAGADSLMINIECFDGAVRKKALPGKGEISLERYRRAFEKAVSLFDDNQVASRIFAGLGESDESIFEGSEYIADLGVIPYLTPVHPATGSRLDGQKPPGAERMTGLYLGVSKIIKEHGLDPFAVRAGMVPSGGESALKEVMEFGI